jgi:hypothetical protein
MTAFTELELAALHSIFSETPELTSGLERQLAAASVAERENSGVGFFTTIAVADPVPKVGGPRVLGRETQARVTGLKHGLGFVLFMENGKLHLLEGFVWEEESTASLDLATLKFQVYKQAVQRIS